MMVSKGSHHQIALFQVSEILWFDNIYIYTYNLWSNTNVHARTHIARTCAQDINIYIYTHAYINKYTEREGRVYYIVLHNLFDMYVSILHVCLSSYRCVCWDNGSHLETMTNTAFLSMARTFQSQTSYCWQPLSGAVPVPRCYKRTYFPMIVGVTIVI